MKEVLQKIVQDPQIEAQWLNTLSLLEFIGARKIGKTVAQKHPSLEVLRHHADETRHAFVFKNLSHHLSGRDDLGYLSSEAAVHYFQSLDRFVSEWVTQQIARFSSSKEDPYQNYLFVTCLIERRAMKLYPLYKSLTPHEKIREALHEVILEEAGHRDTIEQEVAKSLLTFNTDLRDCVEKEEALFREFVSGIF